MRVGSFMDVSCGKKVSEIFFEPLIDLPDPESVEKLHVSPLFSVVQTSNDRLYWRGAYPYNERRKLFEKARAKVRKHVTFETNEITEGSEVRTKSSPIYSAGCVAVNFSSGVPMVIWSEAGIVDAIIFVFNFFEIFMITIQLSFFIRKIIKVISHFTIF